jgi:hypothetical protein
MIGSLSSISGTMLREGGKPNNTDQVGVHTYVLYLLMYVCICMDDILYSMDNLLSYTPSPPTPTDSTSESGQTGSKLVWRRVRAHSRHGTILMLTPIADYRCRNNHDTLVHLMSTPHDTGHPIMISIPSLVSSSSCSLTNKLSISSLMMIMSVISYA